MGRSQAQRLEPLVAALYRNLGGENELEFGKLLDKLINPTYLHPDEVRVRERCRGLCLKFDCHGQSDRAEELRFLSKKCDYRMLFILMELSYSPTSILYDSDMITDSVVSEEDENELELMALAQELSNSTREDPWFDVLSDDSEPESESTENGVEIPLENTTSNSESSDESSSSYCDRQPFVPLMDYSNLPIPPEILQESDLPTEYQTDRPWLLQSQYDQFVNRTIGEWYVLKNKQISETRVLQLILHALNGLENEFFVKESAADNEFWNGERFILHPNTNKSTLGHATSYTLQHILGHFVTMATNLHHLRQFVIKVQEDDARVTKCHTIQGFADGLDQILHQISIELSNIEKWLYCPDRRAPLTLLLLKQILLKTFQHTERMNGLLLKLFKSTDRSSSQQVAIILQYLYAAMDEQCVCQLGSDEPIYPEPLKQVYGLRRLGTWADYALLSKLFIGTITPYLSLLSKWVSRGDLFDEYGELFIKSAKKESEHRVVGGSDELATMQKLFSDRYSKYTYIVDLDSVPEFMKDSSADVFVAGLAIRMMHELERADFSEITIQSEFLDAHLEAKMHGLFDAATETESLGMVQNAIQGSRCPAQIDDNSPRIRGYSTVSVKFSSQSQVIEACLLSKLSELGKKGNYYIADSFRNELNLMKHLSTLRCLLLMEQEDYLHGFRIRLFDQMQRNEVTWADSNALNSYLYSSISTIDDLYTDRLCVQVSADAPLVTPSDIKSLQGLEFSYDTPWPLHVVIDSDSMKQYNEISIFLLQIKRVESAIIEFKQNTRQQRSGSHDRLLHLNTMLHFVKNVNTYILTQCLMISWDSLKSRIAAAITLYEMRQAHQEYLATIHERCFLLPKHQVIRKSILQLFNLTLEYVNQLASDNPSAALVDHLAKKFLTANRYLMIVLVSLLKAGAAPHLHDVILQLNFNEFFASN